MSDCIFCKIVAGEIPSYKIYEDADYLAFLDLSQICDGHTLVIPKKHYRWVWEVEDVGGYYQVVARVAKHFQQVTNNESVVSAVFGEQVPHAHIHLLPQTRGNREMVVDTWNKALGMRKLSGEEMERLKKLFEVS